MDWFLYDNGLRHERVNLIFSSVVIFMQSYVQRYGMKIHVKSYENHVPFLYTRKYLQRFDSLSLDDLEEILSIIFEISAFKNYFPRICLFAVIIVIIE